MYAGKLDVFHDSRNECVRSVTDRICLALQRMIQEAVDQNRTIRCHAYGSVHISCHAFFVVNNFHTTSAKYIGRANHNRVADFFSNGNGFFDCRSHSGFRHWNFQFFHHGAEQVAVLRQVDDRWRSSKNLDAVFLQLCRQIQRCLSSELCDDAQRLLFVVDA